jgi:hypothetical protein
VEVGGSQSGAGWPRQKCKTLSEKYIEAKRSGDVV